LTRRSAAGSGPAHEKKTPCPQPTETLLWLQKKKGGAWCRNKKTSKKEKRKSDLSYSAPDFFSIRGGKFLLCFRKKEPVKKKPTTGHWGKKGVSGGKEEVCLHKRTTKEGGVALRAFRKGLGAFEKEKTWREKP